MWIPGHSSIEGNEKADIQAKLGKIHGQNKKLNLTNLNQLFTTGLTIIATGKRRPSSTG